jgi:hypothetical protein
MIPSLSAQGTVNAAPGSSSEPTGRHQTGCCSFGNVPLRQRVNRSGSLRPGRRTHQSLHLDSPRTHLMERLLRGTEGLCGRLNPRTPQSVIRTVVCWTCKGAGETLPVNVLLS